MKSDSNKANCFISSMKYRDEFVLNSLTFGILVHFVDKTPIEVIVSMCSLRNAIFLSFLR